MCWRPDSSLGPHVRRAQNKHAPLVSATKMMAERLMQDYPQHRIAAQAIIDFANDGEETLLWRIPCAP